MIGDASFRFLLLRMRKPDVEKQISSESNFGVSIQFTGVWVALGWGRLTHRYLVASMVDIKVSCSKYPMNIFLNAPGHTRDNSTDV